MEAHLLHFLVHGAADLLVKWIFVDMQAASRQCSVIVVAWFVRA